MGEGGWVSRKPCLRCLNYTFEETSRDDVLIQTETETLAGDAFIVYVQQWKRLQWFDLSVQLLYMEINTWTV